METRVLVVDDDQDVRESLRRALGYAGYEVATAVNGADALQAVARSPVDLIILDVLMPMLDGLGACRALRDRGVDTPVLVLTARDAVDDRVAGLDAGADDYLVKPFALRELLARVNALLRRRSEDDSPRLLSFEDITLDGPAHEVRRGERRLELTRTEFSLLELFLRHPRQVLTRSAIFEDVWGYDFGAASNTLGVYMGYLRRKTEEGSEPRVLHTVRGVGYILRA